MKMKNIKRLKIAMEGYKFTLVKETEKAIQYKYIDAYGNRLIEIRKSDLKGYYNIYSYYDDEDIRLINLTDIDDIAFIDLLDYLDLKKEFFKGRHTVKEIDDNILDIIK